MYKSNLVFVFHFPKATTHNFNAWKLKLVYSKLFFSAPYLCEQRKPFIDVSSFSANSVRGANEKFTTYIYLTSILLNQGAKKDAQWPAPNHSNWKPFWGILFGHYSWNRWYPSEPSILVHVDAHFRTLNGQRNARKPLENFRSGNEKQVPDFSISAFLQWAL